MNQIRKVESSSSAGDQRKAGVAVARLNAMLHAIPLVTHYIAIEALNAQILALKIVSGKTGLGPITEFARELANQINETVTAVNREALDLTQMYKTIGQRDLLIRHLHISESRSTDPKGEEKISALQHVITDQYSVMTRHAAKKLHGLRNLLSELENSTNATLVVARNIRIEAAMLQEFRESILSVADILEKASTEIRNSIKQCNILISRIN